MRKTTGTSQRTAISNTIALLVSVFSFSACASAQNVDSNHMAHHADTGPASGIFAVSETQEWAKARLAKSPRHQEWVKVKNGTREVNSFVVYPESKSKATAVVVIHEINGMTDWVQSLTDQLAEAGYVAIAPDLLSGSGPGGGGTSAFTDRNAVGQAIRDLPPDQVTGDLNAVAEYVAKLPAANGKVAVGGFCWGGSQTFRYATNNPKLKAAFVFYGSAPESKDELARIKVPVYGFYAANDARINATLPKTIELMKELGKVFDPVTYEGAGHGFMRAGEAPAPQGPDPDAEQKAVEASQKALTAYKANKKARDEAWVRWKTLLAKL
ncbi:MAG: dienelactone hydrolase family protein [Pyrinomonadaceae bacterium]